MQSRAALALCLLLAFGCDETAHARTPAAASPPAPGPVMQPLAPRAPEPPAPRAEPTSRATTRANAGAERCVVGEPAPAGLTEPGERPWIAGGEDGALLAMHRDRRVSLQALLPDGAMNGPARDLGLGRVAQVTLLERLGERYVLAARAPCPGRAGTCGFLYTLDARGAVLSGPVRSDAYPTGDEDRFARRPPLADELGDQTWLWWDERERRGVSLSHRSVRIDADGAPLLGTVQEASMHVCLGTAIHPALGAATPERFAALFGTLDLGLEGCGGPRRRRFLTVDGSAPVTLAGVGQAVRDVAWQGDALHVMFETRDGAVMHAQVARDGSLGHAPRAIEPTSPLPAPFSDRVLPRLHRGPARNAQASLRRFLSSGQRIGEPIDLGRGLVAMTFTGRRFLIAQTESRGSSQVSVRAIDCRAAR